MCHKALQITLLITSLLCLKLVLFSQTVEGEYDSPIIKTLGDVIKLENGKIFQSLDDKQSWQEIGNYVDSEDQVSLNFKTGTNKSCLSLDVHPTLFGLKISEDDKIKNNINANFALTRSIFE